MNISHSEIVFNQKVLKLILTDKNPTPGVLNSKALEGHWIKMVRGPQIERTMVLRATFVVKDNNHQFLVETLSTFWILKVTRAEETLLVGLMWPKGCVFETPVLHCALNLINLI
jgi:hypothetical protein